MGTYAHVMPPMMQDVGDRMGAIRWLSKLQSSPLQWKYLSVIWWAGSESNTRHKATPSNGRKPLSSGIVVSEEPTLKARKKISLEARES
jgi:hypothetical protein